MTEATRECEYCGEPIRGKPIDLYPDSLWSPTWVHPECYEELARTDETLLPLHKHPDYEG